MTTPELLRLLLETGSALTVGYVLRGVVARKRRLAITLDFQDSCKHDFASSVSSRAPEVRRYICQKCGSLRPKAIEPFELGSITPPDKR